MPTGRRLPSFEERGELVAAHPHPALVRLTAPQQPLRQKKKIKSEHRVKIEAASCHRAQFRRKSPLHKTPSRTIPPLFVTTGSFLKRVDVESHRRKNENLVHRQNHRTKRLVLIGDDRLKSSMMKKKPNFDDLSLELKETIVREFASSILSLEYYDHRVDLFALNSLLIERYEKIETGELVKIVQATYADLDKYASQIMIGRLKKALKESH